jgi:hypothetical protein
MLLMSHGKPRLSSFSTSVPAAVTPIRAAPDVQPPAAPGWCTNAFLSLLPISTNIYSSTASQLCQTAQFTSLLIMKDWFCTTSTKILNTQFLIVVHIQAPLNLNVALTSLRWYPAPAGATYQQSHSLVRNVLRWDPGGISLLVYFTCSSLKFCVKSIN